MHSLTKYLFFIFRTKLCYCRRFAVKYHNQNVCKLCIRFSSISFFFSVNRHLVLQYLGCFLMESLETLQSTSWAYATGGDRAVIVIKLYNVYIMTYEHVSS